MNKKYSMHSKGYMTTTNVPKIVAAVAEFQVTKAVKRGSARIWWFDNTASSTSRKWEKENNNMVK